MGREQEVEIRVVVSRRCLLAAFDQATREGRSSLEVIRDRIERPALLVEKAKLADYSPGVRPKSRKGAWFLSAEKLVIALPLALKCEVMRIARERQLSQGEFGLLIVRAALRDLAWLSRALDAEQG